MFRTLSAVGVFASLFSAQGLLAQNRGILNPQSVSSPMLYHRVWVVSPLVGSGKPGDPRRPMFVSPPPQPIAKGAAAPVGAPTVTDRSGVIGYQMQLSDDGNSALVEFVFASPVSFQAQLQAEATARGISIASSRVQSATAPVQTGLAPPSAAQVALEAAVPGLKIFERGKATDSDILTEFRKHKASYTFDSAMVSPQ